MQPPLEALAFDGADLAVGTEWAPMFVELLSTEAIAACLDAVVLWLAKDAPMTGLHCSELSQKEDDVHDRFEIVEDVLTQGVGASDDHDAIGTILEEVRELSDECFGEDCVAKALEKGWTLTLLTDAAAASNSSDMRLCGFLCHVHAPVPRAELHVARLAVPRRHRGCGHGQALMRWILAKAAHMPQSDCGWVSLSALDEAVPFYERFGFFDMTCGDPQDPDHFQTWMELKNISVCPP